MGQRERRSVGRLTDHQWRGLLEEQVADHGRLLFKMAFRVVRDGSLAEEVCQQALLKAWQGREEIRDGAALRGWLVRTVTNESLMLIRRQQAEKRALRVRQETLPSGDAGEDDRLALREELLGALGRLPSDEAIVVTLRLLEQMSGNAVADALELSAAEVSRRLTRGLGLMRQSLSRVTTVQKWSDV